MVTSQAPRSRPCQVKLPMRLSARRNVSAVRSSASWPVADPEVDEPEHGVDVPVVDQPERLGVAGLGPLDQRPDLGGRVGRVRAARETGRGVPAVVAAGGGTGRGGERGSAGTTGNHAPSPRRRIGGRPSGGSPMPSTLRRHGSVGRVTATRPAGGRRFRRVRPRAGGAASLWCGRLGVPGRAVAPHGGPVVSNRSWTAVSRPGGCRPGQAGWDDPGSRRRSSGLPGPRSHGRAGRRRAAAAPGLSLPDRAVWWGADARQIPLRCWSNARTGTGASSG